MKEISGKVNQPQNSGDDLSSAATLEFSRQIKFFYRIVKIFLSISTYHYIMNPFLVNVLIFYPLKVAENTRLKFFMNHSKLCAFGTPHLHTHTHTYTHTHTHTHKHFFFQPTSYAWLLRKYMTCFIKVFYLYFAKLFLHCGNCNVLL